MSTTDKGIDEIKFADERDITESTTEESQLYTTEIILNTNTSTEINEEETSKK